MSGRPEARICGTHAAHAVFRSRPDAILRAWLVEEAVPLHGELLRFLARSRRAYHVTDAAEIERVSQTVHHEGICLLAEERPVLSFDALLAGLATRARPLVALEEVSNPHNVGALLRVAGFFGVDTVLVEGTGRLPSATIRIAEGACEVVDVVPVRDLAQSLERLHREGLAVVGTSGRGDLSLYDPLVSPECVVLFGAEGPGLSPRAFASCDAVVAIPGAGVIESLNVSNAAAVVIAQLRRLAAAGT